MLLPRVCCGLATALLLVLTPALVDAQRVDGVSQQLMREVMPGAERFTAAAGDPPVVSAWVAGADGEETLFGYVFLTSDLPPEQFGYSGPIEALVGMLPDGTLTGVRVTDYRESYMRSMGDFLRTPGFQEQYAGKHIGDPFQLWNDIEGISRVSISVRALSRGVRDAARRVANAYGFTDAVGTRASTVVDPIGLSWYELRQAGVVERFQVEEPGEGAAGIALAWIANERLGAYFLGSQLYERALQSAERRGGAENLMLYAIDGSRLRLFRQQGWSIEQDGDTTAIESRNVISLGLPSGGVVSGEATMVGLMLVDGSVDPARPFRFVYDLGELGVHSVEYVSVEARLIMAEAAARAEAEARAEEEAVGAEVDAGPTGSARSDAPPVTHADPAVVTSADPAGVTSADPAGVTDTGPDSALPAAEADGVPSTTETGAGGVPASGGTVADGASSSAAADGAAGSDAIDQIPGFVLTEDETLLERTLAGASWGRLALMAFVVGLASLAFFTKLTSLRWAALAITLVVLGFVDGGFLSVSHITSGIWAGPGVYLRDLPLLLLVTFTLVTTLVWGRVFCGFLCPFGALQDVIDRVVPKRFTRPLPPALHDRAVWLKYGILALVIGPPLFGSQLSLYQYFEPFGTVFFLSPSVGLWLIAGGFLVASMVVPRFYCRYACPLGAALGVLSLVSLRRIPRVEHCSLCTVCEQKCPTGAIRREEVTFRECVRCNVCEVQLIEQRGVCRHDLEQIRPRLVQIRRADVAS